MYGLGANALDSEAVGRVFEAKGRSRDKPISMALPELSAAAGYTRMADRERRFCERFLPGPVTVLVERRKRIPDVLVAGHDRVGLRVPDHEIARELARRTGPITATSANRSGEPNARPVDDIAPELLERVTVVDGGETAGRESTVVDVSAGRIVRRGSLAEEIDAWLAEHSDADS